MIFRVENTTELDAFESIFEVVGNIYNIILGNNLQTFLTIGILIILLRLSYVLIFANGQFGQNIGLLARMGLLLFLQFPIPLDLSVSASAQNPKSEYRKTDLEVPFIISITCYLMDFIEENTKKIFRSYKQHYYNSSALVSTKVEDLQSIFSLNIYDLPLNYYFHLFSFFENVYSNDYKLYFEYAEKKGIVPPNNLGELLKDIYYRYYNSIFTSHTLQYVALIGIDVVPLFEGEVPPVGANSIVSKQDFVDKLMYEVGESLNNRINNVIKDNSILNRIQSQIGNKINTTKLNDIFVSIALANSSSVINNFNKEEKFFAATALAEKIISARTEKKMSYFFASRFKNLYILFLLLIIPFISYMILSYKGMNLYFRFIFSFISIYVWSIIINIVDIIIEIFVDYEISTKLADALLFYDQNPDLLSGSFIGYSSFLEILYPTIFGLVTWLFNGTVASLAISGFGRMFAGTGQVVSTGLVKGNYSIGNTSLGSFSALNTDINSYSRGNISIGNISYGGGSLEQTLKTADLYKNATAPGLEAIRNLAREISKAKNNPEILNSPELQQKMADFNRMISSNSTLMNFAHVRGGYVSAGKEGYPYIMYKEGYIGAETLKLRLTDTAVAFTLLQMVISTYYAGRSYDEKENFSKGISLGLNLEDIFGKDKKMEKLLKRFGIKGSVGISKSWHTVVSKNISGKVFEIITEGINNGEIKLEFGKVKDPSQFMDYLIKSLIKNEKLAEFFDMNPPMYGGPDVLNKKDIELNKEKIMQEKKLSEKDVATLSEAYKEFKKLIKEGLVAEDTDFVSWLSRGDGAYKDVYKKVASKTNLILGLKNNEGFLSKDEFESALNVDFFKEFCEENNIKNNKDFKNFLKDAKNTEKIKSLKADIIRNFQLKPINSKETTEDLASFFDTREIGQMSVETDEIQINSLISLEESQGYAKAQRLANKIGRVWDKIIKQPASVWVTKDFKQVFVSGIVDGTIETNDLPQEIQKEILNLKEEFSELKGNDPNIGNKLYTIIDARKYMSKDFSQTTMSFKNQEAADRFVKAFGSFLGGTENLVNFNNVSVSDLSSPVVIDSKKILDVAEDTKKSLSDFIEKDTEEKKKILGEKALETGKEIIEKVSDFVKKK